MEAELEERINRRGVLQFRSADHQHYYDFTGQPQTKKALSDFLVRHLTNGKPVPPEQLVVYNGATACLDCLAYGLTDEGEVIIVPTPVYGRIFTDCQERTHTDIQPLYLQPKDITGRERDFELQAVDLENRIQELTSEGKVVRVFILVNPQNPTGDIYPEALLRDLLNVCAKYQMHAIIDEIYALSVLGGAEFTSVLALDDLPDPERTHFIWGMSKDFGLAGIRVGVIHSRNTQLLNYLGNGSAYQSTPSLIHDMVTSLLADKDWCDNFFLPTSQQRLTRSYEFVVKQMNAAGIHIHQSKGGVFAWINISPFMKQQTKEEEFAVFEELLKAGVYMVPGSAMYCAVPGWIRIIFSVAEDELSTGLQRLFTVLDARRSNLPSQ
uniref:1-aminocyclopropane-1-carboxylate synthase-like protein 1 n=1 Tax=Hirondellea gigas TaxID=1518452 RepID=A0A2P2IBW4_9CRUS